MRSGLPVLSVLAVIVGVWYLAVAPMNVRVALDQAERADAVIVPEGSVPRRDVSVWRLMLDNSDYVALGYALERPRLPTPGQVGAELWKTTGEMIAKGRPFSKRGLIYHGWITLQSTLWGFLLGTTLGIVGAVAIVYSRTAQLSLMPWAIISQTIPIVALAPMIIVLSSQV
ncbi:MAG: ABC transporter permease, partial [Pseudomonadota bacterium]